MEDIFARSASMIALFCVTDVEVCLLFSVTFMSSQGTVTAEFASLQVQGLNTWE